MTLDLLLPRTAHVVFRNLLHATFAQAVVIAIQHCCFRYYKKLLSIMGPYHFCFSSFKLMHVEGKFAFWSKAINSWEKIKTNLKTQRTYLRMAKLTFYIVLSLFILLIYVAHSNAARRNGSQRRRMLCHGSNLDVCFYNFLQFTQNGTGLTTNAKDLDKQCRYV